MIKAENNMHELPSNWVWTNLGDISKDVEKISPRENSDKEFLYIDIASIDNKKQKIISHKKYLGKDAPSRARQLIKTGDILFSTVRTYLKNIAIVDETYNGQIASTGFCVIRPDKLMSGKLLFHYSQTYPFLNSLNPKQRGTSYPAVRNSDVFSQPFPLAPLPEQHRIVARIEELFSHLDAGVLALQKAKAQLQRYRQAVLKAAVEGRLTEGWRKAHPEVELIEQTIKSGKKSTERLDLSTYMLPNLPATWKWIALHMIADAIDPQPSHRTPPEVDEGVPYIGIGDVDEDGSLNFNLARKVSKEILIEHRERYQLKVGDFIFGKIGTLGRPARLTTPFNYTLSANVILIKPNLSYINQKFLFSFMESPLMDNLLRKDSRATTQAAFGIKKVRMLQIPLPPQKEQNIIVDRLDQLISVSDDMRDIIEQEINRADHLRQSILKRAFEGKLVSQDPNDEPASVLLERIRAERTNGAAVHRGLFRGKRARDAKQSHLS